MRILPPGRNRFEPGVQVPPGLLGLGTEAGLTLAPPVIPRPKPLPPEQLPLAARLQFESDNREIIDATVGGKLTVFRKIEFTSLFSRSGL